MQRDDADLRLLGAIADDARLAILRELSANGPTIAGDLGVHGVGQSTVSHHLKVLREAGWVQAERRGPWIWYSLRDGAADQLRRIAESVRPDRTVHAEVPPSVREATRPPAAPTTLEVVPEVVPKGPRLPVRDDSWRQW